MKTIHIPNCWICGRAVSLGDSKIDDNHAVVGHRADRSRPHERNLSCEQTIRRRGVGVPALEPRGEREGLRTRYQGFKPDLRNSAVRHYRGAFENVAMVEMRSQLAIERAGLVTLHLQLARRSSIPTKVPGTGILSEMASMRRS